MLVSPFQKSDENALLDMVNAEDSYEHIGQGRKWTHENAAKFLQYCEEEAGQAPNERNNFYSAVRIDGALAGMVGIHTIKYDRIAPKFPKKFFVTFLIDQRFRGKGVGVTALLQVIQQFSDLLPKVSTVYADIHEGNERSSKALLKAGFVWVPDDRQKDKRARIRVGSKNLLRMQKPLSAPAPLPVPHSPSLAALPAAKDSGAEGDEGAGRASPSPAGSQPRKRIRLDMPADASTPATALPPTPATAPPPTPATAPPPPAHMDNPTDPDFTS